MDEDLKHQFIKETGYKIPLSEHHLDWFVKYSRWLENKIKNLGEANAESETGCRLLSDVSKIDDEIIVKFENNKMLELFITQMMDGFGENGCNFTWWHKERENYIHKFDKEGRIICTVTDIDENF